ncbi:MAG: DUF302 domain-containing protein [Gammaproteobacteria bacterium]|nr:DUF302 domain-containing protein [Gammaproteobacteria bacterium]MBU1443796.1 DUF302 domain-containing protein [Gammaproteobacteria bacterium]
MKLPCAATAALAALALCGPFACHAADGLMAVKSPHSIADTSSRLVAAIQDRGLKLFARIDHAAGAATVGRTLRPTEVFIFGNPQGGTPLLECAQSAGIDLPLKALVWQDDKGQAWIGYNDPAWIAARHGASSCAAVPNLSKALNGLVAAVTAP